MNFRQEKIKMGLLQILYANAFEGLYHEDPYTHLTKFYEIPGMLEASETEEEAIFLRLFPHSLITNEKECIYTNLRRQCQIWMNWRQIS